MSHPLDDAYAKLDRAGEHLQSLQHEIRRFDERRPYKISGEADANSGEYVLRIKPEEPDKRISAIIGDILSNLRPALDYLINALAIDNSGKAHASNQFPICDTPTAFQGELTKGRLTGLSARHAALIEKRQPYTRRKAKLWLRWLRDLSNPDKHRHLSVVLSHMEGDFAIVQPPSSLRATLARQELERITISPAVAPLTLRPPPGYSPAREGPQPITASGLIGSGSLRSLAPLLLTPSIRASLAQHGVAQTQPTAAESGMHVKFDLSLGVAFPDGSPVVETMEILESQVAKLIKAFEGEF